MKVKYIKPETEQTELETEGFIAASETPDTTHETQMGDGGTKTSTDDTTEPDPGNEAKGFYEPFEIEWSFDF